MKKTGKLLLELSNSESQESESLVNFKKANELTKNTNKPNDQIISEEDSMPDQIQELIKLKDQQFNNKRIKQKNLKQKIQKKVEVDQSCEMSHIKRVDKKLAGDSWEGKTQSMVWANMQKIKKQLKDQQKNKKCIAQKQKLNKINYQKYQFKNQIKTIPDQINQGSKIQQKQTKLPRRIHNKMIVVDYSKIDQQTCTQIQGVPVYFPYQPYQLQISYMQSIIHALQNKRNALLQSPTGTGKTLCLLSSVFSWLQQQAFHTQKKKDSNKTRIIYLSRTHTQLKQVQKQLAKTCFRPTMANFGSRDQFCIKKQFQDFKGRDLMEACSKSVKLAIKAKRKLQLDEQQMQKAPENGDANGQKSHACEFYKSQGQYNDLVDKMYKNKIVDSEKIKKNGQYYGFCPYFYPFQIQEKADVVFMPYNYILDVGLLSRYRQIIPDSILIFDEAHNVPQSACEGRSLAINSGIFDRIKIQLAKLQNHPSMSAQLKVVAYQFENIILKINESVNTYQKKIQSYIENIFNSRNDSNQYQNEGIQKIMKPIFMREIIYQWFFPGILKKDLNQMTQQQRRQIHVGTVSSLQRLVQQVSMLIQALKQTFDGIFQNIQKFMGFLLKISELICTYQGDMPKQWWNQQINHFRLSIKINSTDKSLYEIRLVCLTPSLTFTQILKLRPRSIILTSGTLSPLHSWQKQLKVKFDVQLQNPHIIQSEQLHMATLCNNIKGLSMNFSYNQVRNRKQIFSELVQTVYEILQRVPNGVLVIFPSYRIINSFKNQLKYNRQSLMKMKTVKQLLFEEKGTDDYILNRFKEKAKSKKGAVLFCVCRGKISEGLDFSDELCRSVIFVGVPFPNIKDPNIKQKKQYCDKLARQCKDKTIKGLTGDQWYNLNTMRAVNQGIGRVIRHIKDYGLIFLLDDRYEQIRMKNLLPRWSKVNSKAYYDFPQIKQSIQQFFVNMEKRFPPNRNILQEHQFEQNTETNKQKPKNAFAIMMAKANSKRNKKTIETNQRKSTDKQYKRRSSDLDFL